MITDRWLTLNTMFTMLSTTGHTLTHSNRKRGNGLLRKISGGKIQGQINLEKATNRAIPGKSTRLIHELHRLKQKQNANKRKTEIIKSK